MDLLTSSRGGGGYTYSAGLNMWTALAGRIASPGIKVDMVPVLVGKQGMRKTTARQAIMPFPEFVKMKARPASRPYVLLV